MFEDWAFRSGLQLCNRLAKMVSEDERKIVENQLEEGWFLVK
jgi:hypothetical protein